MTPERRQQLVGGLEEVKKRLDIVRDELATDGFHARQIYFLALDLKTIAQAVAESLEGT